MILFLFCLLYQHLSIGTNSTRLLSASPVRITPSMSHGSAREMARAKHLVANNIFQTESRFPRERSRDGGGGVAHIFRKQLTCVHETVSLPGSATETREHADAINNVLPIVTKRWRRNPALGHQCSRSQSNTCPAAGNHKGDFIERIKRQTVYRQTCCLQTSSGWSTPAVGTAQAQPPLPHQKQKKKTEKNLEVWRSRLKRQRAPRNNFFLKCQN